MKNLLTKTLGIAGIVGASFLPMKDASGQDTTIFLKEEKGIKLSLGGLKETNYESIKKFGEENRQSYIDFVSFLKEKGKDCEMNSKEYLCCMADCNFLVKSSLGYFQSQDIFLDITFGDYTLRILDSDANGLSNDWDIVDEKGKKNPKTFIENDFEYQRLFAYNYTSLLKRIMHEEKYKNY